MPLITLLDETAHESLPVDKQQIFLYDWLQQLNISMSSYNKTVLQECQEDLVQQLLNYLNKVPGTPTHRSIGRCLSHLFTIGDPFLVYTAINTCNAMLKTREEGSSSLSSRLASLTCLGQIYRSHGRTVGRSFEDSVPILVKLIKQSESQVRCESLNVLRGLLYGVGTSSTSCRKDMFKVAKLCVLDRVMTVRCVAAKCLIDLMEHNVQMYTTDLESSISLCLRCMDGSNYAVRDAASDLLSELMVKSQHFLNHSGSMMASVSSNGSDSLTNSSSKLKAPPLSDALALLSSGFIKGSGGFLKSSGASDMIKGTHTINREVRIGVTYAHAKFFTKMGPTWVGNNLSTIVKHCVGLLTNNKSTPSHVEATYSRRCVDFIFAVLVRSLLSDSMQLLAASHLIEELRQRVQDLNETPIHMGSSFINSSSQAFGLVDSSTAVAPTTENHSSDVADDNQSTDSDSAKGKPIPDSHTFGSSFKQSFGRNMFRSQREMNQQQQHAIVFLLDQLTVIIRSLSSVSATLCEPPVNFTDLLCASGLLSHSLSPVRLACAACLRQLSAVVPSCRSKLLARCLACLQHASLRSPSSQADQILGYAAAVAAIVAGSSLDILGLPHAKLTQVFSVGDDLLRAATQNSRITLQRTQAGWILLSSMMSMGHWAIQPHVPRLIQFWQSAFPRTVADLESEKLRGDAFTWQVMLESRAGALCCMQSFLQHSTAELISDAVVTQLLPVIESALNMMTHLPDIVRSYGNHLKSTAASIRHRLYRIVLLFPRASHPGTYNILLRELVADCTLVDNAANTSTSLLGALCSCGDEGVTLASTCCDAGQWLLEQQVEAYGYNTLGALEHDPAQLFLREGLANILPPSCKQPHYEDFSNLDCNDQPSLQSGGLLFPGGPLQQLSSQASPSRSPATANQSKFPLPVSCSSHQLMSTSSSPSNFSPALPAPIGVAVIDAAIELFAHLFTSVTSRHRLQMLQHFAECIQLTKSSRQEALQVNIMTALLLAVRSLARSKSPLGDEPELREAALSLAYTSLSSTNTLLRLASGEYLGRLAQIVGQAPFLTELTQDCIDHLRAARNPAARAGHCLAVGCLHRYVGGLTSGQHLQASIGLLLSIAQDPSQPEVQTWAVHALTLIADSGGPKFREFVEPAVQLVLHLLLRSQGFVVELRRSLGKLLGALITTLGPELQVSAFNIETTRHHCLLCCTIMQDSPDPWLKAESISCLQKLAIFAPKHVSLLDIVPKLQTCLSHSCQGLRRSAVSCLRQLAQRDASELLDSSSSTIINDSGGEGAVSLWLDTDSDQSVKPSTLPLDFSLFCLLDVECDEQIAHDVEDTLRTVLHSTGHLRLGHWLNRLKVILQVTANASKSTVNRHGPDEVQAPVDDDVVSEAMPRSKLDEEINSVLGTPAAAIGPESNQLAPRWSTKVLSVECLRFLVKTHWQRYSTPAASAQQSDSAHFNLTSARLHQQQGMVPHGSDWLVLHLDDLVRIACKAASADGRQLRIAGMGLMHDIIRCFATVADPDVPGHMLLEQYHAQVASAVRPIISSSHYEQQQHQSASSSSSSRPDGESNGHCDPLVVGAAIQVCSAWLSSAIGSDQIAVGRVYDLIKSGLEQLKHRDINAPPTEDRIYSDDSLCIESVAFLRAWADVYSASRSDAVVSALGDVNDDASSGRAALLIQLVRPFCLTVEHVWFNCLQDYALLSTVFSTLDSMARFQSVTGTFFLHSFRPGALLNLYTLHTTSILTALTDWLAVRPQVHNTVSKPGIGVGLDKQSFAIVLGICTEVLCSGSTEYGIDTVNAHIRCLATLFHNEEARRLLLLDNTTSNLLPELLHVAHRTIVLHGSINTALLGAQLIRVLLSAVHESAACPRDADSCDDTEGNVADSSADQVDASRPSTVKLDASSIRRCCVILATVLDRLDSKNKLSFGSELTNVHDILSTTLDSLNLLIEISQRNFDVHQVEEPDYATTSGEKNHWDASIIGAFLELTVRAFKIYSTLGYTHWTSDLITKPSISLSIDPSRSSESAAAVVEIPSDESEISSTTNGASSSHLSSSKASVPGSTLVATNSVTSRAANCLVALAKFYCSAPSIDSGSMARPEGDDVEEVVLSNNLPSEWSNTVLEAIRGLVASCLVEQKSTPTAASVVSSLPPSEQQTADQSACAPLLLLLTGQVVGELPSKLLCGNQALLSDIGRLANACWQNIDRASSSCCTDAVICDDPESVSRLAYLCATSHLIGHKDSTISAFFIKTLTPKVFRWLCDVATPDKVVEASKKSLPAHSLALKSSIEAAVKLLDTLIDLTEPAKRQNVILITLPVVCNLLLPCSSSSLQRSALPGQQRHHQLALHHQIGLQHAISIASRYPAEFKIVCGAMGELKTRLESALRNQATNGSLDATADSSSKQHNSVSNSKGSTGIRLKNDFSNFV